VSKGEDVRELGNLIGFDDEQLKDYAKSSGFYIKVTKSAYSATVSEGRVISQDPVRGAKIAPGGKVEVVVSKGPETKLTKLKVRTVTIEYVPDVVVPSPSEEDGSEDEGDNADDGQQSAPVPQLIQISVQDKNNPMMTIVDEFYITETTKREISINLEEGQTGSYMVTRDSINIIEKLVHYNDSN
jgi:eukaryotic-like serine/threonine-protein kinase